VRRNRDIQQAAVHANEEDNICPSRPLSLPAQGWGSRVKNSDLSIGVVGGRQVEVSINRPPFQTRAGMT